MFSKDTVITGKQKRQEMLLFLLSFGVSNILNVLAIIFYKTPFREIYTQMFVVVILALVLYLLTIAVRLVIYFTKLIIKKK